MNTVYGIYEQLADVLAHIEPKKLAGLRATKELQERFNLLMDKHKNAEITPKEKDELDHFIVLERLIRLAKIRADNPSGLHP